MQALSLCFYPGWKKVFYLTRGVDTAEFYPRERNLALLEEFGVGTNQRIIMCVANMVPVKGIEILILAFSRLTDKEAVLMLVGDRNNEYGALLEKQADELQIANRVIFTGKRLNIADCTGHGVRVFFRDEEGFIRDGITERVWAEKLQIKRTCRAHKPFTVHRIIKPCHKISVRHIVKNKLA